MMWALPIYPHDRILGFMPALLTADERTRVPLGRLGAKPHANYQAELADDGRIILTPVSIIPARELVIWENAELRASVLRGIAEAAAGIAHVNPDLNRALDDPALG